MEPRMTIDYYSHEPVPENAPPPGLVKDTISHPDPTLPDPTNPGHYTRYKIQPMEFIQENNLPFWLGNVIKYALRYDAKDGVQGRYVRAITPLLLTSQPLRKEPMDNFKGYIDRPTAELLDEVFPPRPPNPEDGEREVWMKAGERRLVDWLLIKLKEQEENSLVPLIP
jgi:hypothetical protein